MAVGLGGMPIRRRRTVGMYILRYHRIDNRKNSIAVKFFSEAIQATDSTFTGCTAKIIAAKNDPGIVNFRNISQTSRASTMCNIKLVAW